MVVLNSGRLAQPRGHAATENNYGVRCGAEAWETVSKLLRVASSSMKTSITVYASFRLDMYAILNEHLLAFRPIRTIH